jgi:IclR family acetate operon transcriptional repressor
LADTSVDKALLVLRELTSERGDAIGVRELAERVRIPRATCHRLLQALLKHGYVRQDLASQRYTLGIRAIELGFAALRGLRLREVARPFLEQLVGTCNETASLSVLDGAESAYIDRVDCTHPVRLATEVGSRNPAYSSAAGRTLLAYIDRDQAAKLIPDRWTPLTSQSLCTRSALLARLDEISGAGYAIDDEEWGEGVSCVAAPVLAHNGQIQAALSVVGPTSRLHLKFDRLLSLVVATAAEISAAMGYRDGVTEERMVGSGGVGGGRARG